MKPARYAATLTCLVISWSVALPAAQNAAAPAPVALTAPQMEEFLLRAKIVRTRGAGGGITGSLRATLSDQRTDPRRSASRPSTRRGLCSSRRARRPR